MKHCLVDFILRMARLIFVIAFLFLWNFLNISADPPYTYRDVGEFEFKKDTINYRLPNNTKPEAYVITISTDIANGKFEFDGTVRISVRVLKSTRNITLHQRQLKILSTELKDEFDHRYRILLPHYDPDTEFLTITTTEDVIYPGNLLYLTIKYKGTLREDAAGFYRSSYTNSNGKKVYEFKFSLNNLIFIVFSDDIHNLNLFSKDD